MSKDIIDTLLTLPDDELRDIIKKANFCLSMQGRSIKDPSGNASSLVQVLLIKAKKYTHVPKKYDLIRKHYLQLNKTAKDLEDIAHKLHLNREETFELCEVLVEAAYFKAREWPGTFTFYTLMYHVRDPYTLLEESFPGYFSTPLFARMVLNAKTK